VGWREVGAGYWELGDLSGGKNSKIATHIRDNEATDCLNWYYWNGELRNLFGASDFCGDYVNGSNVAVSGLHHLKLDDGSRYVIATAGNAIKYYDTASNSWQDITGSLTITPGYKFQMCTFNNTLIATNLSDAIIQWSGSGDASVVSGSPPKAKLCLPYGDFLLLGNVDVSGTRYRKRVYRCNANDITTWDAADYWSFESENGSELTAMKKLGYRTVMYHEDTISFVSGKSSSTFSINADAIPGIGCVGPSAVAGAIVPQPIYNSKGQHSGRWLYSYGHVFRGWDGYYLFNGGTPENISDNLLNDQSKEINEGLLSECVVMPYLNRRQLWSFLPKKTELVNQYGHIFDLIYGGWWPHQGFDAQCATTYQENGRWITLIGGSDGIVRKLDPSVGAIAGVNMKNYWYSKWFDITKPADKKIIKQLLFFVERIGDYDLTVELEYDLPYNKRKQSGIVNLDPGGATYPGVYGTSRYSGKGVDFKGANVGGKGFHHVRIKLSVNDPVTLGIEKIGAYIASAGERKI